MNSLAQPTSSATLAPPQRSRLVGWSGVASGVALFIVGDKAYFPPSFSAFILLASLVLFLGMIPIAMRLANGLATRGKGNAAGVAGGAGVARAAGIIGIAGAILAAASAILALPRWLSPVPAQILDTSALGVIGLWLLVANMQALRSQLFNRVLAVLGVLAGLSLLLAAVVTWLDLTIGDFGSLVSLVVNLRIFGGYLGEFFYLIWALWLGIWFLVRKR